MALPGPFTRLNALEKLAVIRCLRPDRMILALRDFVRDNMGERFIVPPIFELTGPYKESSPDTPLIFVLSSGSDPMGAFKKFSSDLGFQSKVDLISLGQGQGDKAKALIYTACKQGTWVLLQNCHLATSWLPVLEEIIYDITMQVKETSDIHPEFRLWLTSYPTPEFPVAILENGVKLVQEAPKGMRANLLSSYQTDPLNDEKWYEEVGEKKQELKALVFALAFFHALVQERRNFGPLGWNIAYGFNTSDLNISAKQLRMLLQDKGEIPFPALRYLTGECNYGGRVTEKQDRRTLNSLLAVFYNTLIVSKPNAPLSASGNYVVPVEGPVSSYVDYINTMPLTTPPEVFGLHENADITKDLKESNLLLGSLLATSGTGGGDGGDGESKKTALLLELSQSILSRLPPAFDVEQIGAKYPPKYEDSMNTVLVQECIRYNKLTDKIRGSLKQLLKALVGEVVMSVQLEVVTNEIYNASIPGMWKSVSYPSLKPLGSFVNDLLARIKFMSTWVEQGMSTVTWFSGVFFPQSFLTGVLQNYVRKYKNVAIDEVGFDFQILGKNEVDENKSPRPADGVYINGLFLEGAQWSYEKKELSDSTPKVTFTKCPIMWLKPTKLDQIGKYSHYACPVYRVSSRFGVLMTTGHSTNFVMDCLLPTSESADHWVKRGVALLCALDD
jgi:dynein heavy chain